MSPRVEELQMIDDSVYNEAQRILDGRSYKKKDKESVARYSKATALLSGNLYCACCGSRKNVSSHVDTYMTADGVKHHSKVRTVRYMCARKAMKRANCSGQGTYTARYVDDIVKEFMRDCFAKINATPKDVALEANYKSLLAKVRREICQQEIEIDSLTEDEKATRREIPKALMGKSIMKPEDLSKTLEEI